MRHARLFCVAPLPIAPRLASIAPLFVYLRQIAELMRPLSGRQCYRGVSERDGAGRSGTGRDEARWNRVPLRPCSAPLPHPSALYWELRCALMSHPLCCGTG